MKWYRNTFAFHKYQLTNESNWYQIKNLNEYEDTTKIKNMTITYDNQLIIKHIKTSGNSGEKEISKKAILHHTTKERTNVKE